MAGVKLEYIKPTYLTERAQWRLLEDFKFDGPDLSKMVIPAGFVTDGTSVPLILRWLFSPTSILFLPAVVHDYGYKHDHIWCKGHNGDLQKCRIDAGREYWDRLMMDLNDRWNDYAALSVVIYMAIRLFGGLAWRRHRVR